MALPSPRIDYFAFGSNMHISQMATRCPSSFFLGRGILKGYRFQINERGVANIVQSASDYVEGFVFSMNRAEKTILDRNEGVKKGFYKPMSPRLRLEDIQKPIKTVDLAEKMVGEGKLSAVKDDFAQMPYKTLKIDALTYVSSGYCSDGKIREEYVHRMRCAIADGLALGLSKRYFNEFVEPLVEGPVMSSQEQRVAQQSRATDSHQRTGRPQTHAHGTTSRRMKQPDLTGAEDAERRHSTDTSKQAIAAAKAAQSQHERARFAEKNTEPIRECYTPRVTSPTHHKASIKPDKQSITLQDPPAPGTQADDLITRPTRPSVPSAPRPPGMSDNRAQQGRNQDGRNAEPRTPLSGWSLWECVLT
jgi:hypothetical protein